MANQFFRNAQGYLLGNNSAPIAGGATGTVTATAQVPLLLEDIALTFELNDGFSVTDFKLAGQSLMCSDQAFSGKALSVLSQTESFRSISCPIDQNQQFEISIDNYGAVGASFGFAIGTTPIAQSQVLPTSQLGQAINVFFGLGRAVAIPAGGSGTLSATALRPCTLGRLVLVEDGVAGISVADMDDFEITSIKVNNIELLSGSASDNPVPAKTCSYWSTLGQDLLLAYPIALNGNITITIKNNGAGAKSVSGGIFVLPDFRE
tara:strand:+ start:369 stop:1157 length:789 start_codon:yes stop_codon:yes gene_type:complete